MATSVTLSNPMFFDSVKTVVDGHDVFDRPNNAADMRLFIKSICGNGVCGTSPSDAGIAFLVQCNFSMHVATVFPGCAFIDGVFVSLPNIVSLDISTSNSTYWVVLKSDTNSSVRAVTLSIRTATSLVRSGGIYELKLAEIKVPQNTVSDKRLVTADCGVVVNINNQTAPGVTAFATAMQTVIDSANGDKLAIEDVIANITASLANHEFDGPAGREVEFHNSGTYIQWRYVGATTWINLVALTDISGTNATVTVSSVLSTAPGTNAGVYNSGTPSRVELNFAIPRGANGASGTSQIQPMDYGGMLQVAEDYYEMTCLVQNSPSSSVMKFIGVITFADACPSSETYVVLEDGPSGDPLGTFKLQSANNQSLAPDSFSADSTWVVLFDRNTGIMSAVILGLII